jgi:hypothetical protein
MEKVEYTALREASSDLFKNALVAPLAWAIIEVAASGGSFTVSDLRQKLDGRCADNQIHGALPRIEAAGAINQLPFPGKPHPRTWERKEHPFWGFADAWISEAVSGATSAGRK